MDELRDAHTHRPPLRRRRSDEWCSFPPVEHHEPAAPEAKVVALETKEVRTEQIAGVDGVPISARRN